MTMQEIEARRAEIATEIEAEGADLDALETEVRELNEAEKEIRENAKAEAEKRAQIAQNIVPVEVIEEKETVLEERKMDVKEIRNTEEYIDAFAKYLRTGNDQECRALTTTNVSGYVPVPDFVDETIHTAWDKDDILSRVKKTYIRGNLKVAFELSADPAYAHTEGTTAITEEALTLGIVTLTPGMVKKYITISDEVMAMTSREFIAYIYDELTYRITAKVVEILIGKIAALTSSAGSTAVSVGVVTAAPALTTIAEAFSALSAEATNPVIIMNKATYADFIAAQAAANFAFDPFMGLPVLFTAALPSYATATAGSGVYAIVGDLNGAQVNYPEGDEVIIKFDDLSLAEKDLVKVVGRQYAGIGIVGDKAFAKIVKPSAATT